MSTDVLRKLRGAGLCALLALTPLCAVADPPSAASQKIIPATEVSLRKPILRNERLTAYLLNIPSGHATLMHRHDTDILSIFVSGGRTTGTFLGSPPKSDVFAAGDVRYRRAGFTHSTQNDDAASFRSVILEFAQPQGEAVSEQRPVKRTCELENACVEEKHVLCTTGFCVTDVTVSPGAIRGGFASDSEQILVAVSDYEMVEDAGARNGATHAHASGEVEWLKPGASNRWRNMSRDPAHFIVVAFK